VARASALNGYRCRDADRTADAGQLKADASRRIGEKQPHTTGKRTRPDLGQALKRWPPSWLPDLPRIETCADGGEQDDEDTIALEADARDSPWQGRRS